VPFKFNLRHYTTAQKPQLQPQSQSHVKQPTSAAAGAASVALRAATAGIEGVLNGGALISDDAAQGELREALAKLQGVLAKLQPIPS
jgi:hypothetical protein